MKQRSLAAALLVAAGMAVPVVTAAATGAQADAALCGQYDSTQVQGRYVVMNNRWGGNAEQCVDVTGSGFRLTSQKGSKPTDGAPLSYPAIYGGCHYDNCSPGTNLPVRIGDVASASTSIGYGYNASGIYNASYDIWMDPSPKRTGVNQVELMIWLNRQGPIQPIGSRVGSTTIAGRTWEVWQGNNGGNDVVSYLAPSPISNFSFDVLDFVRDVDNRTQVSTSWYLTSVQAGFEPWQGGEGLSVNNFSLDVRTR